MSMTPIPPKLTQAWDRLMWGMQVHRYYLHVAPMREAALNRACREHGPYACKVAPASYSPAARMYLMQSDPTSHGPWHGRRWAGKRILVIDCVATVPDGPVLSDRRQRHDACLDGLAARLDRRQLGFLAALAADVVVFGDDPQPDREAVVVLSEGRPDVTASFVAQTGGQLADWFVDFSLARHPASDDPRAAEARAAICHRVATSLLERLDGTPRCQERHDLEELTEAVGGSRVVRDLLALTDQPPRKYESYLDGLGIGQS